MDKTLKQYGEENGFPEFEEMVRQVGKDLGKEFPERIGFISLETPLEVIEKQLTGKGYKVNQVLINQDHPTKVFLVNKITPDAESDFPGLWLAQIPGIGMCVSSDMFEKFNQLFFEQD